MVDALGHVQGNRTGVKEGTCLWHQGRLGRLWLDLKSVFVQLLGLNNRDCARTLVSLSSAIWKQKRLEEALVLLQSAGEAFSKDGKTASCLC